MKNTLVTLLALVVLALGGCAADPIPPSAAAHDLMVSRLQEGITEDTTITDPDTGEDLRLVCDVWQTYVCELPNGLPHLCRYCVCSHICWGSSPRDCEWSPCDNGI